jgi:predicted Zn finger-like uncharacterized protein
MQLTCPHCQNALSVPDRLRRYYDMPVRCHHCSHVFTVQRQGPRDDFGPAHEIRRPLDRSVSARQVHHFIICHVCGAELRVPGRARNGRISPATPLRLSCPYCAAGFPYHETGDAAHLDWMIMILCAGIAIGGAVLWGHHEGYIELRNLASHGWLAGLRQTLAESVGHLRDIN